MAEGLQDFALGAEEGRFFVRRFFFFGGGISFFPPFSPFFFSLLASWLFGFLASWLGDAGDVGRPCAGSKIINLQFCGGLGHGRAAAAADLPAGATPELRPAGLA